MSLEDTQSPGWEGSEPALSGPREKPSCDSRFSRPHCGSLSTELPELPRQLDLSRTAELLADGPLSLSLSPHRLTLHLQEGDPPPPTSTLTHLPGRLKGLAGFSFSLSRHSWPPGGVSNNCLPPARQTDRQASCNLASSQQGGF